MIFFRQKNLKKLIIKYVNFSLSEIFLTLFSKENEVMIVTPPITIQDEETPCIKDTKQVSDCEFEQNSERKNKIQVIYVSSDNDQ
jgi:hypothetical protein